MTRGVVLFVVFLVIWLIILMPLKLVALMAGNVAGLSYSDVYGSVWDGRMHRARAAGQDIEMVEVSLQPLGLLTGALVVDFDLADSSLRGNGRITRRADGSLLARDVDLVTVLGRVGAPSWAGIDPGERVYVRISELDWHDGVCRTASGDVRTGALIGFASQFGFEGPPLDGQVDCRDDVLVLSLAGSSEDLRLTGEIALHARHYAWQVEVETPRGELADALALAGLVREGSVWRGEGNDAYGG